MATFTFQVDGMQELFQKLKKAEDKSLGIAAMGLYEGASIVADAVGKAVQGIRTEPFKYATGGNKRLASPEEKAAIQSAPHGVAKFRKKLDRVDTTVGYNQSGYVNVNFKHMNSSARTNYKAVSFKGHESNAASFLKAVNKYTGGNLGKGAANQKPVAVIANAINHGTSFMQKQPFMRKAFSQSKNAAMAEIEAGIQARMDELGIE